MRVPRKSCVVVSIATFGSRVKRRKFAGGFAYVLPRAVTSSRTILSYGLFVPSESVSHCLNAHTPFSPSLVRFTCSRSLHFTLQ